MGQARIGRIRLKDGAEVVPLRPGTAVRSDRKADFLAHIARSFDSYAGRRGEQPDSIVVVMGGLKQTADVFWTIRGESQGGGTSVLCLAQAAITREIVDPS